MVSRRAMVYFLQKDLYNSGSHISGVLRSTCQNPGKSYLLSRPCFYYEKNKMKVKLGKLEARKSVAPLCFILSSPPTGQSATIKYQIFFKKKRSSCLPRYLLHILNLPITYFVKRENSLVCFTVYCS